ncbi:MAG: hypothetical protein AAFP02_14830, partial [Bacteroidota bacterium]
DYEYALVEFKPLLDRREESSQQLQLAQQSLKTQRDSLIAAENDLAAKEKLFADIERQFQQRDQYLQEAEELEAIIEITKKAAIVEAHQSRIDNGKIEIDKKKQSAEAIRQSIIGHREQSKSLKANAPDLADVIAVQNWFSQYQQIQQRLQNAKERKQSEQNVLNELESGKTKLLRQTDLDSRQYGLALPALLALLQQSRQQSREGLNQVDKRITDLSVQLQLKSISEQLEEGEPCPVCGSTHHPNKPEYDNLDHHLQKARKQQESLQAQVQEREQLFAQLQAMEGQFAQTEKRRSEAEALVLAAEGERSQHDAAFVWSQFNREDEESLKLHLQQIERNQQQLSKLEADIQSDENTLLEHERDLQKYQSVIEKLQAEREAASIEFKGLARALKRIRYEDYRGYEEARLRRTADERRASHQQIEETYRTQHDRIQRARENAAKLKGRIQELQKQESNQTRNLAVLTQDLEQKITGSQFA